MSAHKYMEEIDEIDNREHDGDVVPTRKKSTRRILKSVLIVILSVLCVTGGVLIHKLNNQQLQTYRPTQLNKTLPQKTPSPTTVQPKLSDPAPKVKSMPSADISLQEEKALDKEVVPELMKTSAPVNAVNSEQQSLTAFRKKEYGMAQALLFKEHFLTGLSCREDYQALSAVQHKTPVMREVLNGLAPYCRHEVSALENVKEAFVNNKRKALVMMYQEKSPHWISYLKSVLVYLIEIRKLNPASSRPKDILYKAQNELYHNNIVKATLLLKQLPPQMQEAMPDFFRESEIYLRADKSLNELILSFEKEGL